MIIPQYRTLNRLRIHITCASSMPAGARKSLEHNAELTAAYWVFDTAHNDNP